MVSERKKAMVKEVGSLIEMYPVIGLLDMYKLPSRQLHDIRESMKGKAVIKMVKKKIMKIIIEKNEKAGLQKILEEIKEQPALLFSEVNPFELAKIIESSRTTAAAKPGDVATKDIVVKEGPTSLKPGPVIGELQRVKIPAGVEGDKIVVKKDTVVTREGEEIDRNVSEVLSKLGIEPMEIGLNLICVYDHGTIYPKEILSVPTEKYENDVIVAYRDAFNLSMNIGYVTKETLPFLITKAFNEALSLAREGNVITKETLPGILAEARAEMEAIREEAGEIKPLETSGVGGPGPGNVEDGTESSASNEDGEISGAEKSTGEDDNKKKEQEV